MSDITDLPSYNPLVASVICNLAHPECYMRSCMYCPPVDQLKANYLDFMKRRIMMLLNSKWKSTNRSELVTTVLSLDDFTDRFCDCVEILVQHDFVKSQAQYLGNFENNIADGEFVVIVNFSENFSFVIQDAAQGYHWNCV